MLWVLWDMLVPLLITYAIGLGTGWLLWRWRRQKVSQPASFAVASQSDTGDESEVNVVLIEERDEAVDRAEKAEAELALLTLAAEHTAFDANTAEYQALDAVAEQRDNDEYWSAENSSAELEALAKELEKEKVSKAEMEQALAGLNDRHTQLLEEHVSIEEVALLESNYEESLQQISKQQKSLQQHAKQERLNKEKHARQLAAKDAELASLRREKEKLQVQAARAAEKVAVDQLSPEASGLADDSAANAEMVNHIIGDSETANPEVANHVSVSDQKSASEQKPAISVESVFAGESSDVETASTPVKPDPDVPAESAGGQLSANPQEKPAAISVEDSIGIVASGDSQLLKNEESTPDEAGAGHEAVDSNRVAAGKQSGKNVTSINASKAKNKKSDTVSDQRSQKPAANSATTSSGYLPEGWVVPHKAPGKSERDDLKAIKGIGPVLEKTLHTVGIYYFSQIAELDKKGIAELDSQLPQFSGRIERDDWVGQAGILYRAKEPA